MNPSEAATEPITLLETEVSMFIRDDLLGYKTTILLEVVILLQFYYNFTRGRKKSAILLIFEIFQRCTLNA